MWEPGLLWAARRRARDVALVLPGERQAGECVRAAHGAHAAHAAHGSSGPRVQLSWQPAAALQPWL